MASIDHSERILDAPVAAPEAEQPRVSRRSQWQVTTFGPASEEPYRRRVVDRVRIVIAGVLLAWMTFHTQHVTWPERDLYHLFNDLPTGWFPVVRVIYLAGALWAVGVATAAALIAKRWRLARDLVVAGIASWIIADAIGAWVAGEGFHHSFGAVSRLGYESPHFPAQRIALTVAMVATASPYLTRPSRRIGQILILLMAVSAFYLGTGIPVDVLGGIFLGWGIAAAVHLIFGSPGGRPTGAQVTAALNELGVEARGVRLAREQPQQATLMVGTDDGGPLRIRVLGRDEASGEFLAKLWRFFAYKDSGPSVYLTRLQQVEHEAYVTLLARDAGVRTNKVIVAGEGGPQTAVLVERPALGMSMADMPRASVSDDELVEVWRQVGLLHRGARVAHGTLDAHHVILNNGAPSIVGFEDGAGLSTARANTDVADLLVSTAVIVGEERAVDAAAEGIGLSAVARSLPYLQPAALSPHLKLGVPRLKLKPLINRVRTVAANVTDVEPPKLEELRRISPTNLLMAVGTLIGVGALLSDVGSPGELWATVNDASWNWALIAFIVSMATNATFAIGLMGTVPVQLPFGPTTELQVSMSFANLAIPAVGGTASQIRFLQKQGVDLPSAVAAGGLLSNVANLVFSVGLLFVAIALSPNNFSSSAIPVEGLARSLFVLVPLAGVAIVAIRGVPRLRKMVMPPVKQAMTTIGAALRSPRQLGLLAAGSVGTNLLFAYCMLACLYAFDASVNVWTLVGLSILISTLASLIPIPGGGTAVASVGMSGALAGFGVPASAAVAAVLLNQVVVSYLPAIPGWFATRDLMRRDYL